MTYPKGHRGSWFADVDGESLPCVWVHWKNSLRYNDRGHLPGIGRWPRFVNAIEDGGKVLLTGNTVTNAPGYKSGVALARKGYLSIWEVDSVEADDASLRFEFLRRLKRFD